MTMTNKVQTDPLERTATAGELAAERARIDLLSGAQVPPRTLCALCQQAAVLVPCRHCWQRPGSPCAEEPDGYHLARFARARRRGLLTEAEAAGVLALVGGDAL